MRGKKRGGGGKFRGLLDKQGQSIGDVGGGGNRLLVHVPSSRVGSTHCGANHTVELIQQGQTDKKIRWEMKNHSFF